MSENRPMQAQLSEELAQRWGTWIDNRIAEKMAATITEMTEAIGQVVVGERRRAQAELAAALTTMRAETRVTIAEAKVEILERMVARLDGVMQRLSDGDFRADAEAEMRRLPAPSQTRQ